MSVSNTVNSREVLLYQQSQNETYAPQDYGWQIYWTYKYACDHKSSNDAGYCVSIPSRKTQWRHQSPRGSLSLVAPSRVYLPEVRKTIWRKGLRIYDRGEILWSETQAILREFTKTSPVSCRWNNTVPDICSALPVSSNEDSFTCQNLLRHWSSVLWFLS
jgi:hypothetical protein